jgi:chloramphenicol-sensitive protein RarD
MRSEESQRTRAGFAYALGAYLAWGFVPAYFKLLTHVPPVLVLSHRIVWSVLFLAILLTAQRKWNEVRAAIQSKRTLLALIGSTTAIAVNWYVFIWAITHHMLLQASLGYFINPLVNVFLGVVILRERLRPGQFVGLVLAVVGVLIPTLAAGGVPWVALSLAFSFGLYALLRKTASVAPLAGLSIETAILFPAALMFVSGLISLPAAHPISTGSYALLIAAGVVTAIPLLLFAAGARRLPLSTLGFLQYISPTCQFLLAVVAYHEPFTSRQLLSFAFIWAGLAAYTVESILFIRDSRAASDQAVAVPE